MSDGRTSYRALVELPEWDAGRCVACGVCVEACPRECLAWVRVGPALRSAHHCTACGVCQLVCPAGAIELREQHA